MSIEKIYDLFIECRNVTIDSRSIAFFVENNKKVIFFALKGDNHDGNAFALKALENGASYCIVDDCSIEDNKRIIKVKDSLKTLQSLANFHRKSLNTKIFAITGSNGKTTTKELLHAVLSKKFNCCSTVGNFNNHIGVPLTLLKIENQHEIAIVEMGANHCKEIEKLCQIAMPNYGIITNIGRAHLEGFGGIEGIKNGKGELFDYLENSGGIAFYLNDNKDLLEMASNRSLLKTIHYNLSAAKVLENNPTLKVEIEETIIKTNLVGDYNLFNIVAAWEIGKYFGIEKHLIKNALEQYNPSNHRSQLIEKGSCKIILDAYNANPSSMSVAISNFSKMEAKNKVLIIGDMKELGNYSLEEHIKVLQQIKECHYKSLLVVGEEFKHAIDNFKISHKWFKNSESLKEFLIQNPIIDSLILIKGSNSIKLENIIDVI